MSKNADQPKLIIARASDCEEWPPPVKKAFEHFVESAYDQPFSVICAVGVNHREKGLCVQFSPISSENPHLAEMCSDIAEIFKMLARRFQQ